MPYKEHADINTLPKCIVVQLQLNRKKFLFTIIYRNPSQSQKCMLKICMLLCYQGISTVVLPSGGIKRIKMKKEGVISDLGLNQLINEPTDRIGEHRSCIDLILTNEPNIFLESRCSPSNCIWQITDN